MKITAEQLAGKPKKIGNIDDDDVVEVATKGGLHIVIAVRKSGTETLGTGSNRAIARHVAKKMNPGLVLTSLAKSEIVDSQILAAVTPNFTELTLRMKAIES